MKPMAKLFTCTRIIAHYLSWCAFLFILANMIDTRTTTIIVANIVARASMTRQWIIAQVAQLYDARIMSLSSDDLST
jgi:hypothetical protein